MDCRWKSTLILLLGVLRLAASAVEVGQCAGTSAKCVTHRDSALLQTSRGVQRRASTKVVGGSTILLRVQGDGKLIAALGDGKVVATRDYPSDRERFVVEKVWAPCGDVVSEGDMILLRAWTGNRVTVQDDGTVRALSDHTDRSESHPPPRWHFVIEKLNADGPILDGDIVYLKNGRTGKYIDADPSLSPEGSVKARSAEMGGEWQKLVVEVVEPWTATTLAPTRVPRPASTTTSAPATGRQVVSAHEWEHFTLVNDLRLQGFTCGSTVYAPNHVSLVFNCRLWRAAYLHSEDMAEHNYVSHNSQDGRSPWDRADEQGTVANAEMIAAGRAGAAEVLEQLKTQEGSCHTLMKPALKALAVGHAEGGRYGHYWTEMLANSDAIDDATCYRTALTPVQAPVPTEIPETSGEPADEMVVDPWTQ